MTYGTSISKRDESNKYHFTVLSASVLIPVSTSMYYINRRILSGEGEHGRFHYPIKLFESSDMGRRSPTPGWWIFSSVDWQSPTCKKKQRIRNSFLLIFMRGCASILACNDKYAPSSVRRTSKIVKMPIFYRRPKSSLRDGHLNFSKFTKSLSTIHSAIRRRLSKQSQQVEWLTKI